MGYLNAKEKVKNISELKDRIHPYADNDFIRNSIYSYAAANPAKKLSNAFSSSDKIHLLKLSRISVNSRAG